MKELIIDKIFSGRFLLTLACAIVFAYCAVRKILPVDATISIITMVFIAYFNRNDRQKNSGDDQNNK